MTMTAGEVIIIKGAGEQATGVAHKLFRSGFTVIMTEIEQPICVRRNISFANCIYEGIWEVEGIQAKRSTTLEEAFAILNQGMIPVLIDRECKIIKMVNCLALVDAIIAKKNTGTSKEDAPIVIGLGPGFNAGVDVDVAIETNRGHHLGRLIFNGYTSNDTGAPSAVKGYTWERVLRATKTGTIKVVRNLGETIQSGETVAFIHEEEVKAKIDGVIRGLIHDGAQVMEGMKIGDIDPRVEDSFRTTISEKARCIAGAVLEAILIKKINARGNFSISHSSNKTKELI